jgi:hypothetical protein
VAKVPPVETLYQLIVPAEANVSKVAVPEMQTEPLVVAVIVGDGFGSNNCSRGIWAISIVAST